MKSSIKCESQPALPHHLCNSQSFLRLEQHISGTQFSPQGQLLDISAMLRSSAFFGLSLAIIHSISVASAHGGHGGLSRTTLNIVNKAISPDGYSRQSVLANGTHPGPLISGHKVRPCLCIVTSLGFNPDLAGRHFPDQREQRLTR